MIDPKSEIYELDDELPADVADFGDQAVPVNAETDDDPDDELAPDAEPVPLEDDDGS